MSYLDNKVVRPYFKLALAILVNKAHFENLK